jgi:hypothetical protein
MRACRVEAEAGDCGTAVCAFIVIEARCAQPVRRISSASERRVSALRRRGLDSDGLGIEQRDRQVILRLWRVAGPWSSLRATGARRAAVRGERSSMPTRRRPSGSHLPTLMPSSAKRTNKRIRIGTSQTTSADCFLKYLSSIENFHVSGSPSADNCIIVPVQSRKE